MKHCWPVVGTSLAIAVRDGPIVILAPEDEEELAKHGGADEILARSFYTNSSADTWGRFAGHEQGAAAILPGIAGVESIRRNQPVNISDLVSLKPEARRLSELV